jgi:hypothetical protein
MEQLEKIGHSLTESAVRRRARTRGFAVIKSRQQQLHLNNHGKYMLVDFNNWVDEFLSRQDAA